MVANCYSVEAFVTAYACNIWPCRDINEWQKMDGPQVNPPVYEKRVGRPAKAKKKQPKEIQGKYGPQLSKHGVVMHCSWCASTTHNVRKCVLKKAGVKPNVAPENRATPPNIVEEQEYDVSLPTVTENVTSQPEVFVSYANTQQSTTMISQMLSQVRENVVNFQVK